MVLGLVDGLQNETGFQAFGSVFRAVTGSVTPPNGESAPPIMVVLMPIIPLSMASPNSNARRPFSVKQYAARP